MTILRKFLVKLRRLYSEDYSKWTIRLLALFVAGIVLGILVDKLFPFNLIFNTIRAAIAVVSGVSLFSLMYILSIRQSITTKGKRADYMPIRKQFSYRQRVNLTILTLSGIFAFTLFINQEGPLYTLFSGLSISAIITMLSFARTYRSEYIKSSYGIPDIRDLDFEKRKVVHKKQEDDKNKDSD